MDGNTPTVSLVHTHPMLFKHQVKEATAVDERPRRSTVHSTRWIFHVFDTLNSPSSLIPTMVQNPVILLIRTATLGRGRPTLTDRQSRVTVLDPFPRAPPSLQVSLPTSASHPLPSHVHQPDRRVRQLGERGRAQIEMTLFAPGTPIFDPDDDGFPLICTNRRRVG